jgi:hypothetical protein
MITDERLKEMIADIGGDELHFPIDETIDALTELLSSRAELARLEELQGRLVEDAEDLSENLVWCGGSYDFAVGGQARTGWERGVMPTLATHRALMDEVK